MAYEKKRCRMARDSIMPDPKNQTQKEQEWADQLSDNEQETDAAEPTYRDGSAQHECWAEDGYTRECKIVDGFLPED